jgi:hypothetical protein
MRPDVIIRHRAQHVVIDASAARCVTEALEAPDESSRQALLC